MEFRIADTFTSSLARLAGNEQKAVKTTAFDLQLNPANPGMKLHKLNRTKDPHFWSVRASGDIRLIVHRTEASFLLCYVDHHDQAYHWAERRRIERHPRTGAAQLVEVRETVREIEVPISTPALAAQTQERLFADLSDDELMAYGVPQSWLKEVAEATEDTLFDLADHLPAEALEALLELATGGTPPKPAQAAPGVDPFAHPDAQRRFRVMADAEELACALEAPWEKWTVFLHPTQRNAVERTYNGPARVAGSAGTGKTIVALHRAAHLARSHSEARVLLTTFSRTLAHSLRRKLDLLVGPGSGLLRRIDVQSLDAIAVRIYEQEFGPPAMASDETLQTIVREAASAVEGHRFSDNFLLTEWNDVVDAWQLDSWEAYRDVARLGRKTRLGEKQRELLWSIFERVRGDLASRGILTIAGVFAAATWSVACAESPLFNYLVVDEAQDVGVPQLRFLAALSSGAPEAVFFTGDLGQRIFQLPFSWLSLGIDVRGRSRTLRINYRTSPQIRQRADRLLPPELSDVDGITEIRRGTVSAFDGVEPTVAAAVSVDAEEVMVAEWLSARISEGVRPEETGVFVRTEEVVERARAAIQAAGLSCIDLREAPDGSPEAVSIGTMHRAKGLEFRAVVVMACDDDVLPLQSRIESVTDDADLAEVYSTERHLLYVACTRARDHLLVTGVDPASEFLDDMVGG